MKIRIAALMGAFMLCMLTGCAGLSTCFSGSGRAPFKPPEGCLLTQVKAPLTTEFNATKAASKQGKASSTYIMIPCCYVPINMGMDNCDIETAARNGHLATVEYADVEYFSILGVFKKTTVTAYGEQAAPEPAPKPAP